MCKRSRRIVILIGIALCVFSLAQSGCRSEPHNKDTEQEAKYSIGDECDVAATRASIYSVLSRSVFGSVRYIVTFPNGRMVTVQEKQLLRCKSYEIYVPEPR